MMKVRARAYGAGLFICTLGLGLGADSLGAQESKRSVLVAGVADAETGQALEDAEVVLIGLRRLARTNGIGEARIDDIPFGRHRVRVRTLGYAPADIYLEFKGDTTGAVFRLTRSPTTLPSVDVEAEPIPSGLRAAETRRRRGIGRFLAADELDAMRDRDLGSVVSMRFPGLRVVSGSGGQQVLVSTRAASGQGCRVHVYIDDVSLGADQDLWFIRTWDLTLVEYYTPSQVPPAYRTRSYGCGVLLLWSKWY